MNLSEQTLTDIDRAFKVLQALEDIRSDIDTLKLDTMYRYVGDFRYGVDTVVAIIDKHTKGVNE